AKAGIEDGVELIGGSCIITPLGQVLAKAATTGDELIVARIDLEQIAPVTKRWNFLGGRQPQHYGRLLMPVTEKETNRLARRASPSSALLGVSAPRPKPTTRPTGARVVASMASASLPPCRAPPATTTRA